MGLPAPGAAAAAMAPPAGGPTNTTPAALNATLAQGLRELQNLGLDVEGGGPPGKGAPGKPGQFPGFPVPGPGVFPGFPGQGPGCHGGGPGMPGVPGFPPGFPGGPGIPSLPPGVQPIPAPPAAMKPVPAPAGAPPLSPDGSKVFWYTHAASATPVGVSEATVKHFGLKTL